MKKVKLITMLVIVFTLAITALYEGRTFITGFLPAVDPGSQPQDVQQMQQTLKNWGYYNGNIDGSYGWQTFLAVKDFQKTHGLAASGIAGEDTLIEMGLTRTAETGVAYAEGSGIGNAQLLARAINGEARGESYMGQVAVGAVIINRTRDPKFPKTIAGVIYQPGAFTAVSDGQINISIDPKSSVGKAAQDALNGWDPTYGCVYYWNPATATSKWIWGRKVVAKIGNHYFGK